MTGTDNLTDNRKIFIILNPAAGFTNPTLFHQRVKRICSKFKYAYEIFETKEEEGFENAIEKAISDGFRIFVAAGGDGTISELASYLVNKDVVMGIIPCGTGNSLAKTLGIPLDIGASLRLITGDHNIRKLDALRIYGKYHILNVGVGITSAVVQKTTRPIKRKLGIIAYIVEAIKAFFGIQPYSFRLIVDGQAYQYRASEIFIACGGWLGIQLPFSDLNILPDDGRADIFIIKARSIRGYLRLAFNILFGKPHQAPQMKYLPAYNKVRIESKACIPVQSDGDWIGDTPVEIEVCSNVVNMIVPNKNIEPLIIKWRRLVQF